MDFYSAAAPIAERGIPVYAVKDFDKAPEFVPLVQEHGKSDATTDLARLAALNQHCANANVGVRTGILLPTGKYLHILDGDRHQAGVDGVQTLQAFGLHELAGPLVQTPRNGKHFYCTSDSPLPSITGLLPGVDLLGDKGSALVPLSRTPAGVYQWIRDLESSPLPPIPGDLLQVILEHQARKAAPTGTATDETPQTSFSSVMRRFERAERGVNRNDELNRAAFQCGRLVQAGLVDEQEAKDALTAVAATLGLWQEEYRKTDRTLERAFDAGLVARGAVHAGSAERVQAMRRLQDAARASWPGRTGVSDCKTYVAFNVKALTCGSNELDISIREAAQLGNMSTSTVSLSVKRLESRHLVQRTAIAGEPLQDVDGTLIISARSYRLSDVFDFAGELSINRTHNRLSGNDGAKKTGESVPQSAAGERQVGAESENSAGGAVGETGMCSTYAQFSASLPRLMAHDAFSWGGLKPTGAQLYATLLDGGPLTVSELVTRTGRSRSGVYVVLERLSRLVDESTGEVFPPLVSKVDGRRWQANSVDLDELAVFLHVDGRQERRKAQHEHERENYRKLCEQNTAKERLKQPAPTAGTRQAKHGDAERTSARAAHDAAFVAPRQKRMDEWREIQRQIADAERQLGLVRGLAPRTRHQAKGTVQHGAMVGAKRNTTGGNDVAGTGRAPVADDRTVSGAAAGGPAILGWIPNGTERVH